MKQAELVQQLWRRFCEELAGEFLPEMLKGRANAEAFLDHADANLRRAALLVIGECWEPTPEFGTRCSRMVLEDRDGAVRLQALGELAGIYAGTDDTSIGGFLARIAGDCSHVLELRKHAYGALFVVRAMPAKRWLEATSEEFHFPENVDWEFVESFLREG